MAFVCWLDGCLTSQQQASVSQGRICSDNCTSCHTEIEVADQTFYLTRSQYTDTGPTSPSADPRTPGAWQGSQFLSHWYDSTPKKSRRKRNSSALEADALPLGQRGGRKYGEYGSYLSCFNGNFDADTFFFINWKTITVKTQSRLECVWVRMCLHVYVCLCSYCSLSVNVFVCFFYASVYVLLSALSVRVWVSE